MAPSFILAAKNAGNDEDCRNRLSDLPDSVIHHIFSLLEMNDFVRVAFCSKRFQELSLSNPYIYLTSNPYRLSYMGPTRVRNLVDRYFFRLNDDSYGYRYSRESVGKLFAIFLDNYLSQREDTNVIQSFHLEFNDVGQICGDKGRETVDVWLHHVAKCNVQELYVNSDISSANQDPFSLPQPLLRSNCLRVLELELPYCEFELPSAIFSSLEILSMKCSSYSSKLPIGEWISTHCPSLKKLSLVHIDALHFESKSVTDLTIISAHIFPHIVVSCVNLQELSIYLPGREKESKDGYVQVCAPNLQVLKWGGKPDGNINLGDFPALQDVTLYRCRGDDYPCAGVSCLDGLFNLVKSSSCAKVLRISLAITEVMFLKDQELVLFENLEQLVIRYHPSALKDYHTASIADFVRRSPNLSSLIIEKSKDKHSGTWTDAVEKLIKKKAGYCNRESRKIGQQVKEVKIQVLSHDECTRLVNHLMKSADGLENMTIFYSLPFFDKLAALLEKRVKWSPRAINIITHLEEEEEEKEYD